MFSMVKKQNGPYFFSSPVLCTSFATVLTRQAALQSLSDSRPCRAPQSCREGSSREPLRSENLSGSVWAEGLQHPGMQQPAPPGVPALSHALSHWRAAQPSKSCQHGPICGGDPPPVNPDSCDGMDRCLIASHMAVMYQATSEHPSNDDGRKTNRRQSRLQLSPAGLYGKGTSPMSFIKLKLHLDPFGTWDNYYRAIAHHLLSDLKMSFCQSRRIRGFTSNKNTLKSRAFTQYGSGSCFII